MVERPGLLVAFERFFELAEGPKRIALNVECLSVARVDGNSPAAGIQHLAMTP